MKIDLTKNEKDYLVESCLSHLDGMLIHDKTSKKWEEVTLKNFERYKAKDFGLSPYCSIAKFKMIINILKKCKENK